MDGAAKPHPPIPIFCKVAATRPVSPIGEAGRFIAGPLGEADQLPLIGSSVVPTAGCVIGAADETDAAPMGGDQSDRIDHVKGESDVAKQLTVCNSQEPSA